MMKDDSVYVSKNLYFRNNLDIKMERNEANNQLKAYCQANKILIDQIRELKEYVETIKASLPSNAAQSSNESQIIGARPIMIERDRKTPEKKIDRMLKVMPYFNGDSIDNFESCVLSAKKTLSYGKNYTDEQKLDVVFSKIRGNALETLEHCGNLNNNDLVFSFLKKIYGKDQRASNNYQMNPSSFFQFV